MRSCEIELGNLVETNDHGEIIKTYVWNKIFAQKMSVKQSEFYSAANVGLKPELTFEIYLFEFNYQEELKYNGKIYSILRTYEKGEKIELVVSSQVSGGI